jgi:hypothetical protein
MPRSEADVARRSALRNGSPANIARDRAQITDFSDARSRGLLTPNPQYP